jgi:hypothetical protein
MEVARGCIAKRKGVLSRANLLILVKCFVDDIVTSDHQPRIVALNYPLVAKEKRSKEKNLRINVNECARKQLHS